MYSINSFACCARRLTAVLLGAAILCAGCSGSARVNLISLNNQAIDPPRVEPYELAASECCWWVDDAGDLCIAAQAQQNNLFLGQFGRVELDFSLVLDKPPAGLGRDYPIRQRDARLLIRSALQNHRFMPIAGIISVLTKRGDEMHGSFRIWMNPINEVGALSFLPPKTGPILCYGTFKAVRNPDRGKIILQRSEEWGFARPPKQTSQPPLPTTQPVADADTNSNSEGSQRSEISCRRGR